MIQRRTPLRKVSLKKEENKRTSGFAWPMAMADILKANKDVTTAAKMTSKPKPRKKPKARSPNNSGWVDVAKKSWDAADNSHCCEVCGCFLGDEFSPTFFHHLLHRGSYRKMKREPLNLAQVCPTHHDMAHEYGIEALAEEADQFRAKWQVLCARMIELRNAANGIT